MLRIKSDQYTRGGTNHRNNHNTMMLLEGVPCAVLTVQKKIMKLEKWEEKDGIKRDKLKHSTKHRWGYHQRIEGLP